MMGPLASLFDECPKTRARASVDLFIERGDVEVLSLFLRAGFLHDFLGDDESLSPAYLAIAYDRPEVLYFLAREGGVDLRAFCDDYGTPAFYASYDAKVRCLEALARLGVDLRAPCTVFGEKPASFFQRHDPAVVDELMRVLNLKDRAAQKIARWLRKFPLMERFRAQRHITILLQRRWRHIQSTKS